MLAVTTSHILTGYKIEKQIKGCQDMYKKVVLLGQIIRDLKNYQGISAGGARLRSRSNGCLLATLLEEDSSDSLFTGGDLAS